MRCCLAFTAARSGVGWMVVVIWLMGHTLRRRPCSAAARPLQPVRTCEDGGIRCPEGGGAKPTTGCSVRVLGSISVSGDHRPVRIGGEKPRRLLAVLVLHRNTVVSTDRIMQVMWDDDIPDTAVATLQSYISRLRRLLPPRPG